MDLQDEIDIAFTKVFEELRDKHEASIGKPYFMGQVTGIMLKTAIRLAKDGGCPRRVLVKSLVETIDEAYRS